MTDQSRVDCETGWLLGRLLEMLRRALKRCRVEITVNVDPRHEVDVTGGQDTRYYFFGNQRVAMRTGATLYFLHSDHLGSTSLATDESGTLVPDSLLRYFPYYGSRMGSEANAPTDYLFTGQRREQNLGGLFHMGARFYHPGLGRWISADTIVPDPANLQSLNRYSYARNSPLVFVDPAGHYSIPPPPFRRMTEVTDLLNHPYIKPLWANPQIGIPVLYSLRRESLGNATEAQSLALDWYFERGEAPRTLGTESEITQHLIRDVGVQEAREAFREGGGRDMIGIGSGAHEHKFDTEFFDEVAKLRNDDWSGTFLGGYHVEFKNWEGYKGPGKMVDVTVLNDTGWASGTRIPFTAHVLRENEPRWFSGPGGTLWQYYKWTELFNGD